MRFFSGINFNHTDGESPAESKKPRREDRERCDEERCHDENWFCVANLYGDIKDVDSMRAIVVHLNHSHENTKKAVESESQHNWIRAIQYYRFCTYILFLEHNSL